MSIGLYYENKKISGSSDMKFEAWKDGVEYKTGNIIVYNEKLYRCLLDHTSSTKFEDDEKLGDWQLIVGSKSYEEEITTPSKTWNITHGLKCQFPQKVYIFDDTDNEILFPEIEYKTENMLIVNFDVPICGTIKILK